MLSESQRPGVILLPILRPGWPWGWLSPTLTFVKVGG